MHRYKGHTKILNSTDKNICWFMCGYYREKLHVSHFWELKGLACYQGSSLFLIKLISFGSSLQNPWPNDTVLATLNQKLFAEGKVCSMIVRQNQGDYSMIFKEPEVNNCFSDCSGTFEF